jgi:hypothetical protein
MITDCHKVHMAKDVTTYNESRGIENITTAPHSQWMDPSQGYPDYLRQRTHRPCPWRWATLDVGMGSTACDRECKPYETAQSYFGP